MRKKDLAVPPRIYYTLAMSSTYKNTETREHTQGPWQQHNASVYSGKTLLAVAYCEGSRELHSHDKRDILPDSDGNIGNGWEDAWANAQLIAAAPELLEALQMLMPQEPNEADSYDTAMWENAKQAIEKATGRRHGQTYRGFKLTHDCGRITFYHPDLEEGDGKWSGWAFFLADAFESIDYLIEENQD